MDLRVVRKMGPDAARMRGLGLAGSGIQLFLAVLLGGMAGGPDAFPNPPEPISRGLALGLLFAMPAIVGVIGAIGSRQSMLASAAMMSSAGSVLAFSGVTLVFLVPALVFAAATTDSSGATPSARPSLRPFVMLSVAFVGIVVAALRLGILVLPLIVLLVLGLEIARGRRDAARQRRLAVAGTVQAIAVICLGIGAGWALLAMTETRCWEADQTPAGIVYRIVPDPGTGPISLGPGELAGGCDSGVLTVSGAMVALSLGLAAVALAAVGSLATRR